MKRAPRDFRLLAVLICGFSRTCRTLGGMRFLAALREGVLWIRNYFSPIHRKPAVNKRNAFMANGEGRLSS